VVRDFNKAHGKRKRLGDFYNSKYLRLYLNPLDPFPSSGFIDPLFQPWTFLLILEIIFTYLGNTVASLSHGISKSYLLKIHF
jgi:hypothetical protein